MTAALIGSAVALAAYALGFWTARRTARHDMAHGGAVVGSRASSDNVPMRLSYGEAYCPRCDAVFVGTDSDPNASAAFRDHLRKPPHDRFGRWPSD